MKWPQMAHLALALVAAACLASGLLLLPLVWDGSYYLYETLNDQAPFVAFRRYGVAALTAPAAALSYLTGDPVPLRYGFALAHALTPIAGLGLSWLVIRRARPDLLVWPALGIGVALAQGQALAVAGTLMAAEMSWPLLFAALIPPGRKLLAICAVVATAVALSHPTAALLLAPVAVAGWSARRRRAGLVWTSAFAALIALNIAVLTLRLEPYELLSAEPIAVAYTLSSEIGPQAAGLVLAAVACAYLLRAGASRDPAAGRALHQRALIGVALAALPLLSWALDGRAWQGVVGFRIWAVPLTLPLLVAAAVDTRASASHLSGELSAARLRIAAIAGAILLLVTVAQGATWSASVANVERAVSSQRGCTPADRVVGYADSPLANWSITPLSVVLQGRTVHAYVAEECASGWPAPIPMPFGRPLEPRWFRFE